MKNLTCIDTKLNKGIYTRTDVKTVQFINGKLIVTYVDEKGEARTLDYTKESLQDLFIIIS